MFVAVPIGPGFVDGSVGIGPGLVTILLRKRGGGDQQQRNDSQYGNLPATIHIHLPTKRSGENLAGQPSNSWTTVP